MITPISQGLVRGLLASLAQITFDFLQMVSERFALLQRQAGGKYVDNNQLGDARSHRCISVCVLATLDTQYQWASIGKGRVGADDASNLAASADRQL